MSNQPENFVDYFKIKWSRKSAWTLEEGAYLTWGKNPEEKIYEISVHATNPVSKRYYWLLNRVNKKKIIPIENVNGVEYFNTGTIVRALNGDKKFPIEKDMAKAYDHMWQAPFGVPHFAFVTRAVYREAGRLVFEQYPKARIIDVAEAIQDLPAYYNNDNYGHVETKTPDQIAEFLKKLSQLEQKPSHEDIVKVKVDLKQVVEMM